MIRTILAPTIIVMDVFDPTTGKWLVTKRRRRFDAERMPRELMFSCFHGMQLLSRDRSRRWFVDALSDERMRWPIDIWAWVIMPEHVHLLVAPREPNVDVGRFSGRVKERTARKAIAWLEKNSPAWLSRISVREGTRDRRRFWQPGGGHDRNIHNFDTLVKAVNYFHMNPVKRGLVSRPEEWLWSSAGWYAGIRPAMLEMDPIVP